MIKQGLCNCLCQLGIKKLNAEGILVKSGINAGLGNRILPLLSALAVADRFKLPVNVDWTDGQYADRGVNAFTEYFYTKNIEYFNEVDHSAEVYPEFYQDLTHLDFDACVKEMNIHWKDRYRAWFDYPYYGNAAKYWVYWHHNFDKKDLYKMGIFSSAHSLFKNFIGIKESILEVAQRYISEDDYIGVHFRATDFGGMGQYNQFKSEIEKYPKTRIFLATDSALVHEKFLHDFGERVEYFPKSYGEEDAPIHFNSKDKKLMAESSIIDMHILSRSTYFIGTKGSTFSKVACEIFGRPKYITSF